MRAHVGELAVVTGIVIALAIGWLFIATPLYSADVMLRVDPPEPNALGIALQNQEAVVPATPSTAAEITVMQSRSVLQPVIDRYGFDVAVTPRTVPLLGAIAGQFATPGELSRPWLGLDTFAWGGEQLRIGSITVPQNLEEETLQLTALADGRYELRGPSGEHLLSGTVGKPASAAGISMTVDRLVARPGTRFEVIRWNSLEAVARFAHQVRIIGKGKDTGIIVISYMNESPALAAEVANALARQYIAAAVAARQRDDTRTLEFINGELPRLRNELKRTEEALNAFRKSSQSLQPTSEAQAYLQGGIDLQRQIATVQLQRTQLLQRFRPDSEWVRNTDMQLAQLNAAKATFDTRFSNMSTSERNNLDLARDARVSEAIYLAMVNKAEQLTVRRASTTAGVNIVDSALTPHRPVKPDRLLVISAGAGIGLFVGAFLVFIRRHVMTGVTDPRYVEHAMGVPVIGEVLFSAQQARLDREISAATSRAGIVPGSRAAKLPSGHGGPSPDTAAGLTRLAQDMPRVLAARFPKDVTVEALRDVRTTLNLGLAHVPGNVVMCTGPTPAAGKSFVAANLAVLQAEIGSRVLLIDADMRRGRLAYFFGQLNRGGLSDVLTGDTEPADVIRSVGVPGLSFLSCGTYPDNPAELLMKRRFKEMLARLGEEYDLVIIDTPPFLSVTDASIVASEAGATVLVLRSGLQTENEISETLKKLERAEAHLFGAIFNAMPVRSSNRAYHYAMGYKTLELAEEAGETQGA
ncbi:polysaccharide biosynthesis tyrosine autokinase [Paraburkholderia sp. FT54]|uniref:polysaccharide biosynthesis tyrosine autokinase n=1 Tax=Paraburkholderia sp. FT54 TaxID=3074437 RepID=UPI00287795F1|nr:polysaccharide biosynthesis tyrosine autokinase [Paraburkholderia sp. FT54]WNC89173.1 polysaccharide biosynthesis tyrosine autokinase [Paraburkholderia sp. FT54]